MHVHCTVHILQADEKNFTRSDVFSCFSISQIYEKISDYQIFLRKLVLDNPNAASYSVKKV